MAEGQPDTEVLTDKDVADDDDSDGICIKQLRTTVFDHPRWDISTTNITIPSKLESKGLTQEMLLDEFQNVHQKIEEYMNERHHTLLCVLMATTLFSGFGGLITGLVFWDIPDHIPIGYHILAWVGGIMVLALSLGIDQYMESMIENAVMMIVKYVKKEMNDKYKEMDIKWRIKQEVIIEKVNRKSSKTREIVLHHIIIYISRIRVFACK